VKRNVFSCLLKEARKVAVVTLVGRLFHARAAVTRKDRSPMDGPSLWQYRSVLPQLQLWPPHCPPNVNPRTATDWDTRLREEAFASPVGSGDFTRKLCNLRPFVLLILTDVLRVLEQFEAMDS